MVLLRGAERSRRTAVACALVALAALQGLHPQAGVASATATLLRPVQGLFLRLAAEFDALFAAPVASEIPLPPEPGLAAVERRAGAPPTLEGLRWLEVPVMEVSRGRGELHLAAGSELGLEPGMVVAFGTRYLGRLFAVDASTSRVRLVDAAAERTGIRVRAAPEVHGFRAVALGRQAGGAPVVELIEATARPRAGDAVLWRPGLTEEGLESLGLRLGRLAREGDEARGRAVWTVELERPAGAEGRVFVALPERGGPPPGVAARGVDRSAARLLLRADAVLGPGVPAVLLETALPGAVLSSGPRVVGEIAVLRGRVGWVRRRAPRGWGEAAVGVRGDASILSGTEAQTADVELYTRGDARVPRGLWLGPPTAPAAALAEPLVASVLAPLEP